MLAAIPKGLICEFNYEIDEDNPRLAVAGWRPLPGRLLELVRLEVVAPLCGQDLSISSFTLADASCTLLLFVAHTCGESNVLGLTTEKTLTRRFVEDSLTDWTLDMGFNWPTTYRILDQRLVTHQMLRRVRERWEESLGNH